ncbi:MAG: hypothetical protein EZS28_046146, partial [Streblomastix strix]
GDIVPDQVTPASDANPLVDSGTGVVGTSTEYSRGDHQHQLQVSENIPKRDIGAEAIGESSRDDHQHILNIDPTVINKPMKDTGTGINRSFNYYARSDHQHPLNIDPTITNQLSYDGNITATKFIKIGGLATEVLCANVDTKTIDNMLSRTQSRI